MLFLRRTGAHIFLSRSRCAISELTQTIGSKPSFSSLTSSPTLSIWRRKKEMGKEGIFVVQQLKRLASSPSGAASARLDQFMRSHVSRLLRTDLLAVLAELQRQDLIFLAMKIYGVVRKEIWYHPDMYFYRDMLFTLARNKKLEEARKVWSDLKSEEVRVDQHTYGDLVRAFCDSGMIDFAMELYEDMRGSSDPPESLPFRVMLKGLVPYPEIREKVKQDFLDLFPHMVIYDSPDDLFDADDDDDNERI
ncbi:Pentatricopeptide repeat-containing protein [Rhynchospora pubera]|uniref:Pentatricopeptide repeat-containing protein n=1 Tax=Rhynchospora pubera TaxID=906938 RepID=A0AAV8FNJ3_9POAL|nr:Pentatricopeptide repeat-containing protein [Rhynchospora pubera]